MRDSIFFVFQFLKILKRQLRKCSSNLKPQKKRFFGKSLLSLSLSLSHTHISLCVCLLKLFLNFESVCWDLIVLLQGKTTRKLFPLAKTSFSFSYEHVFLIFFSNERTKSLYQTLYQNVSHVDIMEYRTYQFAVYHKHTWTITDTTFLGVGSGCPRKASCLLGGGDTSATEREYVFISYFFFERTLYSLCISYRT